MDELNYLKKWLDRNIDEHTTAPIGEIDTKTLAEAIIKEGFSRRPEPLVRGMEIDVNTLANEIRIFDGNNDKGAGAIAEHLKANAHVWLKEKDTK